MDCIKEAEKYLRYYRQLKRSIEHVDRMINRLTWQTRQRDVKAAQLEATGIHADHPVNTLNQFYELQKWQAIKANTIIETEKIENALNFICKGRGCIWYKDILTMWYVDGKTLFEIACDLSYSEAHIKRLKKQAIKSFSITLFGIDALKAI